VDVASLRRRKGAVEVGEIPEGRDVVLFCSCPSERTSANVALLLEKNGLGNLRMLYGGYEGWIEAGYAVETIDLSGR
jgi:rhodanese-related sulfurtransferase